MLTLRLRCGWGDIVDRKTGQRCIDCEQEVWDTANEWVLEADNKIAHLKKLRLQQAKSQQPQSEKRGFFR